MALKEASAATISDFLVSEAVEEDFAPRLIDLWGQLHLLDFVLNISIFALAIHLSLVGQSVVGESEGVLIRHDVSCLCAVLNNLEQ